MEYISQIVQSTKDVKTFRVENFELVRVDDDNKGQFYIGDCQIVVNFFTQGKTGKLFDVHYWRGDDSTKDEYTANAIQAVQLMEELQKSGMVSLYGEQQDRESEAFQNQFKGIKYLKGGIAGGFTHVTYKELEKKTLFKIKGRYHPCIYEVNIDADCLNEGDSYILQDMCVLQVYNGPKSNKVEQYLAKMYCDQYKESIKVSKDASEIEIKQVTESNMSEFLESLNLTMADIKPAAEGGVDDKQFSNTKSSRIILATVEVDPSKPNVSILNQDDDEGTDFKYDDLLETDVSALILPNEMQVWMSTESRMELSIHAFSVAQKVIEHFDLDPRIKWSLVTESLEPFNFMTYFTKDMINMQSSVKNIEQHQIMDLVLNKDSIINRQENSKSFIAFEKITEISKIVQYQVTMDKCNLITLPNLDSFNSNTCYIIQFFYNIGEIENLCIFFWKGLESTVLLKSKTAQLVADQIKEYERNIRVTDCGVMQAHEDYTFMIFLQHIDKQYIISTGGEGLHFKCKAFKNQYVIFSEIKEVKPKLLNNFDCFIFIQPKLKIVQVFKGKEADTLEIEKSLEFAEKYKVKNSDFMISECNDNNQEFLNQLKIISGENTDLILKEIQGNTLNLQNYQADDSNNILQQCNFPKTNNIHPIRDFCLTDFKSNKVMFMDALTTYWVWFGRNVYKQEYVQSLDLIYDFMVEKYKTGTFKLVIMQSGSEPDDFKDFLLGWDQVDNNSKPVVSREYLELKRFLNLDLDSKANVVDGNFIDSFKKLEGYLDPSKNKYTFDELVGNEFPIGVNPVNRESQLKDEEFEFIFKMSRIEYDMLKDWRKLKIKRDLKLIF